MVGAYLLAGEKAFQAAAPQLCGLAKALRAEAGDDSLLLHIDAATGTVLAFTMTETSKISDSVEVASTDSLCMEMVSKTGYSYLKAGRERGHA